MLTNDKALKTMHEISKLKTPIFNSAGNRVRYTVLAIGPFIKVMINKNIVGSMQLTYAADHLYINRMCNHSVNTEKPFKGVNRVLFEYAFRMSISRGYDGKIMLDAIGVEPVAYFKMGFRRCFSVAVVNGVMKYGPTDYKNDKLNQEFEKHLATTSNVTWSDCYRFSMQGMMYLPATSIERLKHTFLATELDIVTNLDTQIPIGGSQIPYTSACASSLNHPKLKDLVLQNRLSAANAVVIDRALKEGTLELKELDILLSDIGLEMMAKNYISAWYVKTYFYSFKKLHAVMSPQSLNAFKENFISVNDLVHLHEDFCLQLFSELGLQALYNGEIGILKGQFILDIDRQAFLCPEVFTSYLQKMYFARQNPEPKNISSPWQSASP